MVHCQIGLRIKDTETLVVGPTVSASKLTHSNEPSYTVLVKEENTMEYTTL